MDRVQQLIEHYLTCKGDLAEVARTVYGSVLTMAFAQSSHLSRAIVDVFAEPIAIAERYAVIEDTTGSEAVTLRERFCVTCDNAFADLERFNQKRKAGSASADPGKIDSPLAGDLAFKRTIGLINDDEYLGRLAREMVVTLDLRKTVRALKQMVIDGTKQPAPGLLSEPDEQGTGVPDLKSGNEKDDQGRD